MAGKELRPIHTTTNVARTHRTPEVRRAASRVRVGDPVHLAIDTKSGDSRLTVAVVWRRVRIGWLFEDEADRIRQHLYLGRLIIGRVAGVGTWEERTDDGDRVVHPSIRIDVWDRDAFPELGPPPPPDAPPAPAARPRPYRRRRRRLAVAIARRGKPAARWARLSLLKLRRWLFPRVTWDD